MGLALLAVGILSGLKAYMQSVGKAALEAILGSRYIGGCERVIDSGAAERMIAISKMLKRRWQGQREPCHFIREYFGQIDRVYNLHNRSGVEAYIKSLHVI